MLFARHFELLDDIEIVLYDPERFLRFLLELRLQLLHRGLQLFIKLPPELQHQGLIILLDFLRPLGILHLEHVLPDLLDLLLVLPRLVILPAAGKASIAPFLLLAPATASLPLKG